MSRGPAAVSSTRCTLVLVRHAHTKMAGRFCGVSDPPLSAAGIAQLAGLNEQLKDYPLTNIYSSNLQRARQTAESIAASCGLKVQLVSSLHELAFGSWEGLDWDEVMARDPDYAQRWLDQYPSIPAPGGECFEDFRLRIQGAITTIAATMQNGCAAVVTHGGVIRTFLAEITRAQKLAYDPAQCDYGSCSEVWYEGGRWSLPIPVKSSPVKCAVQPELRD